MARGHTGAPLPGTCMSIDPEKRTEPTGSWAGFGFQRGHLWTPEGRSIHPQQLEWLSLTCEIAREWQRMMDEVRVHYAKPKSTPTESNVIYLRDVIGKRRRELQERAVTSKQAEVAPVERCELGGSSTVPVMR